MSLCASVSATTTCSSSSEVLIPGEDDQVGGGLVGDPDYVVGGDTRRWTKLARSGGVAMWRVRNSCPEA